MKVSLSSRRWYAINRVVFYILLIVVITLLAQLSIKFNRTFDWTANSKNTLSEMSQTLLDEIGEPVTIQVFISPNSPYKNAIEKLITRYTNYTDKLIVNYIDPQLSPDLVRSLNVQAEGEIVISQGEKQKHVLDLSEQSFTNALIAMKRNSAPWLVFIEGHGERDLFKDNQTSISTWTQQLKAKGYKIQALNLIQQQSIPENTQVLVIASALTDWLPGEIELVKNYIASGGNLLWLADPDQTQSLTELSEYLGIEIPNATVLDPSSYMLGINDPRFVLVSDYANHPIAQGTGNVSLFADSTVVEQAETETNSEWQYTHLINSQAEAWLESDTIIPSSIDQYAFDVGADMPGPLPLAQAMSRNIEQRSQRVVVMGDSDFLTNGYIGNGGNLQLAMATINWLSEDDDLIAIPLKSSPGTQLLLTPVQSMVIGFGFLVVLPLLFLIAGGLIWWKRRRQ